MGSLNIPARVAARAATRYAEDGNGHHVSTYSVGTHGYAQVGWHDDEGKAHATTAHRAAWVYWFGPIPDGMTVDHDGRCPRPCVHRDHLRLLENFENARRTLGRDWKLGECINGHPNSRLHTQPNGRTRCIDCRADYQRAYRARQRAKR